MGNIDGSIFIYNPRLFSLFSYPLVLHLLFLRLCQEFTMKITQKIQQSHKEDKVWWSFEYFPPRTAQVFHMDLKVLLI